jgi:hypothetical protein
MGGVRWGLPWRRVLLVVAALATAAGCGDRPASGLVDKSVPAPAQGAGGGGAPDGDGDPDEVEGAEAACAPGGAPVRRLTKREYNNTVRDLLGDTTRPADVLPPEEDWHGFTNMAEMQSISPVLTERYMLVAEGVAARATRDLRLILPCSRTVIGEDACMDQFIQHFGKRAFRRPLNAGDTAFLRGVYDSTRARGLDFRAGTKAVIAAALQSPDFLYRIEEGVPVDGRPGVWEIKGYEMATRLSFHMWGSTPDDALLEAAGRGELDTPAGLEAQARRMVKDPRARDTVREFHQRWLQMGKLPDLGKDFVLYPEWTNALKEDLLGELDALVDHVVWEGKGDILELFTAPYTFVNDDLARYYGLPVTGEEGYRKVNLPGRASGVLSQGALMAVLAKPNETSPVLRGKFVREQLMCQTVPPPPDNVVVAPETDPSAPARERMAQHLTVPSCNGCHTLMDPIGFGFEKFDASGRFREREKDGSPVDDNGEVIGQESGTFKGVGQMGQRLAANPKTAQCVTLNWFRFAQGRPDKKSDACNLKQLEDAFNASGGRIPELLVAITQTEAFRFRSNFAQGK